MPGARARRRRVSVPLQRSSWSVRGRRRSVPDCTRSFTRHRRNREQRDSGSSDAPPVSSLDHLVASLFQAVADALARNVADRSGGRLQADKRQHGHRGSGPFARRHRGVPSAAGELVFVLLDGLPVQRHVWAGGRAAKEEEQRRCTGADHFGTRKRNRPGHPSRDTTVRARCKCRSRDDRGRHVVGLHATRPGMRTDERECRRSDGAPRSPIGDH